MTKIMKTFVTLIVLGLGAFGLMALMKTAPKPEKAESQAVIPKVAVVEAKRMNHDVYLTAHGVVIPAQQLSLKAQVSGEVVGLNPSLVEGGRLEKGAALLEIDPRDYELAIRQSEQALANAKYALELEMGRQTVAAKEWALFGESVKGDSASKELALRKPHLENAEANLEAAQSSVDKAKLNLERTKISAPFNSVVTTERIEIGEIVSPGQEIARLIGVDQFWVRVSMPYENIQQLSFADQDSEGSKALIKLPGQENVREGRVIRLLSDLEEKGRMARILVEVSNPLRGDQLPLLLGAYVEVRIQAERLENVIRLPYEAVRHDDQGSRVWVMDPENRLGKLNVEISWRNHDAVYISHGLQHGMRIITSNLSTPLEGLEVQTIEPLLAKKTDSE